VRQIVRAAERFGVTLTVTEQRPSGSLERILQEEQVPENPSKVGKTDAGEKSNKKKSRRQSLSEVLS
ncbi:MAG TPA: hypothetical protein VJ044_14785, partial [Candidatus Hodarchaeales archaeon]|nr:hypothetical protein [Candidatus Hodarchaeales archaeon]